MSVFGPNQVEELIIGNAVATETTLADFISTASDQEIKILSADGTAPAAGEDFRVFQKTAGSAAKGLASSKRLLSLLSTVHFPPKELQWGNPFGLRS